MLKLDKKIRMMFQNNAVFLKVIFGLAIVTIFLFIETSSAIERPSHKALNALTLAKQSIQRKDYVAAVRFATRAISISPRYIPGYQIRAKAWIQAGNYVNAIKDYTSILRIEPVKMPQIYRYRGDCLVELGKYSSAIKEYTKSLKLNPKLYKSLYYRARAYALSGQIYRALKDIECGLALGSHHNDWFIKLREAILMGKPIPYNSPVSN